MLIANLLFYILSAVLVFSAVVVITARNPVHSILFLVLAFFNSAGLFLMLGAEFIAMLMVIVYVGAVAVLFLFVVMMLDVDLAAIRSGFVKYTSIGLTVAGILLMELVMVLHASTYSASVVANPESKIPENVENTKALGEILYTQYVYHFQLAGVILLVAMVGAIVLTLRHRPGVRKQSVAQQVARVRGDAVALVKVQSKKGV